MAGIYEGEVRGGVVVFEEGDRPPEGTKVRVEPIGPEGADPEAGAVAGTRALLMAWARRAEALAPELPPDLAEQHDRYAHGKPRG